MEENITEKENTSDFTAQSPIGMETEPEIQNSESESHIHPIDGFHSQSEQMVDGTSEESENNQEKEKLEKEVAELKDKYVRLYAEFDNFKRRTSKERSDLFKTANKEVLVSLLPVLDDLERAQKSFVDVKEIGPVKEGISLITSKFKNIVAQQGITEIKSIGETFDTDLHEAITNVPAPSDKMKGKVIDEMEKGYMLNDKVIRFAKVIVGV